ncbi:IS30 family transposase [Streptomyces collinus]|uniref:IS30 family transposase n=1 Tax=Streptomyces collinus TaxID=42684 RepID=UPI0036A41FD5
MPRFVAPTVLIDRRPPIIELRERLGDWEDDLVVGARSQSAVATLVDRRTRYLRLVPLPEGHSAGQLRDALIATLNSLPERAHRSLTGDQGSEMGCHHELAPYFTDGIFFAHPGSPWERGTNEYTNSLIRRYLPKRTNLSLYTADELRVIDHRLNNRLRKKLSWQTPAQAFAVALAL